MRKFDFGSFMIGLLFGIIFVLIWCLDIYAKVVS